VLLTRPRVGNESVRAIPECAKFRETTRTASNQGLPSAFLDARLTGERPEHLFRNVRKAWRFVAFSTNFASTSFAVTRPLVQSGRSVAYALRRRGTAHRAITWRMFCLWNMKGRVHDQAPRVTTCKVTRLGQLTASSTTLSAPTSKSLVPMCVRRGEARLRSQRPAAWGSIRGASTLCVKLIASDKEENHTESTSQPVNLTHR